MSESSVNILGTDVSAADYELLRNNLKPFMLKQAREFRQVLEGLARMRLEQADGMYLQALTDYYPAAERAKAAWNCYAFHQWIKPYEHDHRKHFVALDRLPPIMQLYCDSYYMWAVYWEREPTQAAYDKLKTMHPDTARQYWAYAAHYQIAKSEGYNLDWTQGILAPKARN